MKWDRVNQRRALVWGAWSLVLLVGLLGLLIWHSNRSYEAALGAFAAGVGSPDHRDYLSAPVPDAENAAVAFAAASEPLEIGPEWARTLEPVAWTEETESAARRLLAGRREVLVNLAGANRLPSCVWPDSAELDTQPLLALLRAASLLRLEAFVALADRDPLRLESTFRLLGRLAECLYAAPHLVGALVAVSVERTQLEVVHAAVSDPHASPGLLQELSSELERMSRVDRVARAVAVEGALALRLLESRPPEEAVRRFVFNAFLFKRMSATLALRWTDFAAWSRTPFDELLGGPGPGAGDDRTVSGMVADLTTMNLRHAIVRMRANRELINLARLAIEGRLHGIRRGSYAGAFAQDPELSVLEEGDGSVVLIDQRLEALLRDQLPESGENADPGLASTLQLTVWRLPAPNRAR